MKDTDANAGTTEDLARTEVRAFSLARRDFLKAAGGVGVAAAALNADFAEAAADRTLPAKWDETADVLVVGSGFAGIAAAAAASAAGGKVIVLEKMPAYGGNSAINLGDYAAWDDALHLRRKLNLGDDSAEQHKQDALAAGEFYNDPALVDVMTSNAPAALDWMVEQGGLKLREVLHRQGLLAYRMHYGPSGGGRDYLAALGRIAERHGTELRAGHKVAWVWRKAGDAPVLGLEVATPRGTQNFYARKGVILAAGGFGADVAMRQAFRPILTSTYNCTNQRGATGEMIRLAQAVGADALHLAFIEVHPYGDPESGALDTATSYALQIRRQGAILVGRHGKRFVNELAPHDFVSRAEVAVGAKPTFTILNEEMLAKLGDERTAAEVPKQIERGRMRKSESLRGLAQALGIDAASLEETARKYNQYVKDGRDPDFNRPFTASMAGLERGPYYAILNWPSVHHTMGGLRINPRAQVIDIWGRPIPRLYAAGEVTGGVHGAGRVGGNSTVDPIVFGRIAGTLAAQDGSG